MTSTRSFTPTSKQNSCLVCSNIKGKCRQTAEAQRQASQTPAAGATA